MLVVVLALLYRERKHYLDAYWDLVFEHISSNGNFFNGANYAYNCDTPYLYSSLIYMDNKYIINGSYEFLLEYPELSGYNRWSQSNNPMYETESNKQATGYKAISIKWSGRYWGGLCKSKSSETYIDGSTLHSDVWWYSIGSKAQFQKVTNGIPGPCTRLETESCTVVKHVKLFARMLPPVPTASKFPVQTPKITPAPSPTQQFQGYPSLKSKSLISTLIIYFL